jgi:hypothetical protein
MRGSFGGVSGDDFEDGHDEPSDELKGDISEDGFENYQNNPLNELKKNKSRMLSDGRAQC